MAGQANIGARAYQPASARTAAFRLHLERRRSPLFVLSHRVRSKIIAD